MSLPYFPLYPKDYEAKTAHLSILEDGAYNRLMRLCWLTPGCSLPDDEAWIMRRMRAVSDDEKEAVRSVLAEFFTREGGRVFQRRLRDEAMLAAEAHQRRVEAGRRGGRKHKALKDNETWQSNAKAKPKQPEPEPYTLEANASSERARKRATRLPDDWKLPREWGEWALSEGWPEDAIRAEADKFRDYWISKSGKDATKRDWLATWRNWMRRVPKHSPKQQRREPNDAPSATDIARRAGDRWARRMDSGQGADAPEPLFQPRVISGGAGSGD